MLSRPTITGIAIAALLAAIAWAAVLEWRGQQPVTAEESDDVALRGNLNVQHMQDTLTDRINSRPPSEAQVRMESHTGQALSRLCIEWTELYDIHPTDENRDNRDQSCREFRKYVDTGALPDDASGSEPPAR